MSSRPSGGPGYANFAISEPPLKLVLLENPGHGGTLNHLGIEVADPAAVEAEQTRLAAAGLMADGGAQETTCCYATQEKFWAPAAPDGESWEVYTGLADSPPSPVPAIPPAATDRRGWPRHPPNVDSW